MGNMDFCPHVIDCNDGVIVELFDLDTAPDAFRALATNDGKNYVTLNGHVVIRNAGDVAGYLDAVFDHFSGLEDF